MQGPPDVLPAPDWGLPRPMTRNFLRFALVSSAIVALCGGCAKAAPGHPGRGAAPAASAFSPEQPALPVSAPDLAKPEAGPAPGKAEAPSRFAGGLLAQNAARADFGLQPLAWAAAQEAEARAAVAAISALTCSRALADRMGASHDVSAYWAPSVRQLDGAGSVQELSSSFVVSEWLQERAQYSAAAGCARKNACDNYLRMIRPTARTVGCAIALCADQSQVWACRYGE